MSPFQQKGDGDSDKNKEPNQNDVDMSHTQFREEEHGCSKKKQRPGDAAVQGPIPKPIGDAADCHRK